MKLDVFEIGTSRTYGTDYHFAIDCATGILSLTGHKMDWDYRLHCSDLSATNDSKQSRQNYKSPSAFYKIKIEHKGYLISAFSVKNKIRG